MFMVLFADMLELPDTYCIVEKERPIGKLYSFLNSKKRNVKKKSRGIFRFRRKRRFKLVDKLYISHYELTKKVKELSASYEKITILLHNASVRKPRYPLAVFYYLRQFPVTINMLFLDARYMRCFEKVEDIDWDWLKEPVTVDYGYKGEFSPKVLLQKLNETC